MDERERAVKSEALRMLESAFKAYKPAAEPEFSVSDKGEEVVDYCGRIVMAEECVDPIALADFLSQQYGCKSELGMYASHAADMLREIRDTKMGEYNPSDWLTPSEWLVSELVGEQSYVWEDPDESDFMWRFMCMWRVGRKFVMSFPD